MNIDTKNTRAVAYVNHGRWIVDCPICGAPIWFNPAQGNETVCGACNPDKHAFTFMRRMTKGGREVFDPIPDTERREKAINAAPKFKFLLPSNWKKINETLRPRHISKMNWLPGETVNDLIAENIQHGVKER